jgi:hypothetical protein
MDPSSSIESTYCLRLLRSAEVILFTTILNPVWQSRPSRLLSLAGMPLPGFLADALTPSTSDIGIAGE